MKKHEWPANDYAIGSYIQATVSDLYFPQINIKPSDHVLDIGCGDGGYTTKILAKVPHGAVTGIDRSENMLQLAREKIKQFPNFSVRQADVLAMGFNGAFDYVVSFWCMQWCPDHEQAFMEIYRALKKGGQLFILLPTGDDPLMTTYHTIKNSGDFPCLKNFVPLVNYAQVGKLPTLLPQLPFASISVETPKQSILLPSLDVFRKFVNGIAFYNGQVPEQEIPMLNEAMVEVYDAECRKNYGGEYRFDFSVYVVKGMK